MDFRCRPKFSDLRESRLRSEERTPVSKRISSVVVLERTTEIRESIRQVMGLAVPLTSGRMRTQDVWPRDRSMQRLTAQE